MLSEDVKLKFSGFEPSQDVKSSVYYLLNRLHLKAPHQSFLSATFTLTNGIIEGVIKISSGAEDFVDKATGVHISEVGEKLMDRITTKLDKWKSLRAF